MRAPTDSDPDADGEGDGVVEADDVTAMTMVVSPLNISRKPVARISVTDRARMNRMRTPPVTGPRYG
jgi:hypothetical protein